MTYLVSGFYGSGKSTFIIELIKKLKLEVFLNSQDNAYINYFLEKNLKKSDIKVIEILDLYPNISLLKADNIISIFIIDVYNFKKQFNKYKSYFINNINLTTFLILNKIQLCNQKTLQEAEGIISKLNNYNANYSFDLSLSNLSSKNMSNIEFFNYQEFKYTKYKKNGFLNKKDNCRIKGIYNNYYINIINDFKEFIYLEGQDDLFIKEY